MEHEVAPGESVSMAVVSAVSTVVGRDAEEIRPLAEVLDPDALDALFAQRENGASRRGGEVSFIYSDCRVTIQNGEYLSVRPLDLNRSVENTDHGPAKR